MFKKGLFAIVSLFVFTSLSFAEAERARLTRENAFPELGEFDAGVSVFNNETDFEKLQGASVFGRYMFYDNFTLRGEAPYLSYENDVTGEDNSGFGDVTLGLDLLIYEDIFDYPFVIPHAEVSLSTGDEDENLGTGETIYTFGISVGTKTWDQLTWIIDLSMQVWDDDEVTTEDDELYVSGSLIWDVDDDFAVLLEGRIWEENDFNESPTQVQGGMVYKVNDDLQLAVYVGRYTEAMERDVEVDIAEFRTTLEF